MRSNGRVAEGGTLLRCYVGQPASRVQIPITPFLSPQTENQADTKLKNRPVWAVFAILILWKKII